MRTRALFATSLFIGLFLILFRPFFMDSVPFSELLATAVGSGAIYFCVSYGLNHLRSLGYWPFAKLPLVAELIYLILLIFLVGLGVYIFRLAWGELALSLQMALLFQWFAFLTAIITTVISRLLVSVLKLQVDLRTRSELNQSPHTAADEPLVKVINEDGAEEFAFPFDKWIAGKAAGNYVELYFSTNNHKPAVVVRTTLKQLSEAMAGRPEFMRCHRSYVVNLAFADKLTGPAQARKLILRGLGEAIPVSRSYEKPLQQKLDVRPTP